MSGVLRQSTSTVLSFGPFVSPSDGVALVASLVSALDHVSTGIMLSKNGGALAVRHAAVTATTYDGYGNYLVTLDATDTGTVGRLRVQFAAAASCLPVWRDFDVITQSAYDALFGASAVGYATPTNITAASGVALTSGERTAIANEVEAQIIDDTDSEKVLVAITDKIASVNPSLSGLTLAAIASQVRTELATELARIDAAISTRLAAAGYTSPLDAVALRAAVGLTAANLDTQIGDLPTNGELATALAGADDAVMARLGAPTGASISADIAAMASNIPSANQNADALLDRANGVEGGWTPRQTLRIFFAALAGKASGLAGTTAKFRDVADTKDRITATVDANGNRTAVTLDAS